MPDTTLEVHVQPGAKRNEVVVTPAGQLRVRVAAPAMEGKANRELLRFLTEQLGVRPAAVRLIRGERSRVKVVVVAGLGPETVRSRLLGHARRG